MRKACHPREFGESSLARCDLSGFPLLPESTGPLCSSCWKFGATDVPKAHPCGDGSVGASVALRSLAGEVSVDHRVITGRHG